MPAVAPLPPEAIRRLLEAHVYTLVGEDAHNWAFASRVDEAPILVPTAVDLVPVEIAFHVARQVGFTDYFEALAPYLAAPAPPEG